MNKVRKLLILIILSSSVYFIYNNTKNSLINITNIGDSLALGINPYGIKETSHIDFYNDYLQKNNINVNITEDYAKKDLTINSLLNQIKENPSIKKDLLETDILFLTVGYNDLIYKMNIQENISISSLNNILKEISKEYSELLTEIRKYYKRDIVVIGYYTSNKNDYYINKGIRKLNEILSGEDIEYIDTYYLLSNRQKYFSNPSINYPNRQGYQAISKKIIEKRLEKTKNI